jgi:hypothetical protein
LEFKLWSRVEILAQTSVGVEPRWNNLKNNY